MEKPKTPFLEKEHDYLFDYDPGFKQVSRYNHIVQTSLNSLNKHSFIIFFIDYQHITNINEWAIPRINI